MVEANAGIVDEICMGVVAPKVSVKLVPIVGIPCGFCCELASTVASAIDEIVGFDGEALLLGSRTVSGSCFLLLKSMHNKNHKFSKQQIYSRKI